MDECMYVWVDALLFSYLDAMRLFSRITASNLSLQMLVTFGRRSLGLLITEREREERS